MDPRAKKALNERATKLSREEGLSPSEIADRLKINRDEWRFKSRGKGKVTLESVEQRKKAKSSYSATRQTNRSISTPSDADTRRTARKVKLIKSRGMEADHIQPVSRTGTALRGMSPERQAEYKANMRKAGIALGDQPENFQQLTGEANRLKETQYQKLDRHLRKMEQRNAPKSIRSSPHTGDMEILTRSQQLGFTTIDPVRAAVDMLGNLRID